MTSSMGTIVDSGKLQGTVLMLTWVAGSVDAVSYFGLGHVFTANMTGNTVLLGLALGHGEVVAAARSFVALLGYMAGAAAGTVIVSAQGDSQRSVRQAILAEGIVLLLFTLAWNIAGLGGHQKILTLLIALSALAMGIQSVAVRKLNLPGIVTTYITGTITSLVSGLAGRARRQLLSTEGAARNAGNWEGRLKLQAAVFVIYGLSAAASGIVQSRWPAAVSFSPLIAVALVLLNMSSAGGRKTSP
jgi:uncharacterized membrane protein YoaK (UPF0700 family)